jgi:hypothetical protein
MGKKRNTGKKRAGREICSERSKAKSNTRSCMEKQEVLPVNFTIISPESLLIYLVFFFNLFFH